jgi:hypothetical protein
MGERKDYLIKFKIEEAGLKLIHLHNIERRYLNNCIIVGVASRFLLKQYDKLRIVINRSYTLRTYV